MKTHNAQNERVKRRYFAYLKEAKRYSEASLDTVAKAFHRFESYTKMRDLRPFTSSRRSPSSGASRSRSARRRVND